MFHQFRRAAFGFLAVAAIQISAPAFASVALVPGLAPLALPGTTAALEADLAGTVVRDDLIPFRIVNAGGAALFEANLQNRIVRSTGTGRLHFYYRIRDTKPGLNGIVRSIWTDNFQASPRILSDWRQDGLGTVNPKLAERSGGVGQFLRFGFDTTVNVLVGGRESRFFFAKTSAKLFSDQGKTTVQLTSGEFAVLKTLMPIP